MNKKRKLNNYYEYGEKCYECGKPHSNCYCRTALCICCDQFDYRYNMVSNLEINDNFYRLPKSMQDKNLMCLKCIYDY